ncbi:hypothetical protein [Kitasatospora sp. NPDC096140]|uniref:hypothetical protein n=1 Tax=Kitasatospora sp. NPDC096140 TaxID=3155425 RepID=UPI0033273EFB
MKIPRPWRSLAVPAAAAVALVGLQTTGATVAQSVTPAAVPSVVSQTPEEACAVANAGSWTVIVNCFHGQVAVARAWLAQICTQLPATVPRVADLCRIQITGTRIHTEGPLVFLTVEFRDLPDQARGFSFVGIKGSHWAYEKHSFDSPSYGRVHLTNTGGSIDYPFNQSCGTAHPSESDVRFWINDFQGINQATTSAHLKC